MEINSTPFQPPAPFAYGKESVTGVLPYIRSSNFGGVNRWMVIFTTAAAYFVYCGMDRSFMVSNKAKKLDTETQNKNLEELLRNGKYFYRADAAQISGIHSQKGWFGSKIWFVNSEKNTIRIKLKNSQYAKFLELSPLIKASGYLETSAPKEITRESLDPLSMPPVLTEEERKQEKRRRRALGLVLLINSLLGLGLAYWLGTQGVADASVTSGVIPAIIDISIAIALFKSTVEISNQTLQWVFARAVLGFLLWGGILISKQDWVAFVMQVPYFSYLIYHSKVKATARSFKIAMVLLAITVVVFAGGMVFSYNQGKQTVTEFTSKLIQLGKPIDDDYTKERDLVFFKGAEQESDAEVKARRKEILEITAEQKTQIENIMPLIDEGLKEFPDTASQTSLENLKILYGLENAQNQAVADLYGYIDALDSNTLTPDQQKIYDQKEKAVEDAYAAVRAQGLKMQNE